LKIGIDIDGTITEHPEFFVALSKALYPKHDIHILTGRDEADRDYTVAELEIWGIHYHHLHIVNAEWPEKGRICTEESLDVLFDDMDEFIHHIPKSTLVFKVRNGGNYCWERLKWLF